MLEGPGTAGGDVPRRSAACRTIGQQVRQSNRSCISRCICEEYRRAWYISTKEYVLYSCNYNFVMLVMSGINLYGVQRALKL